MVFAVVVPAYTSTGAEGSTIAGGPPVTVVTSTSSRTLVQVNGGWILILLAIPLLMVVAVAVLLPRHRRLAWAVTVLVFGFVLAGAFTIGPFVYPVGLLLVVACALDYASP